MMHGAIAGKVQAHRGYVPFHHIEVVSVFAPRYMPPSTMFTALASLETATAKRPLLVG